MQDGPPTMWKLSIEDDHGAPTVVQLVRSEYTLGRAEENTIRLTERNVSRCHARLLKQGAGWFLADLESYNGCYVNGARAVETTPVGPTDLIQIGDYRLEFITDEVVAPLDLENSDRTRTLPNLATSLSSHADRLVMVVGPTPGREYLLVRGRQTIGRGEDCSICINHASVSRVHSEINYIEDGRYEIIDQGSSNGIRINGVELSQGLLDARDLVEFGDIVLKFIVAGQVYKPSPEESQQLAALLGVDPSGATPSTRERIRLLWNTMSRPTRIGMSLLATAVVLLFGAVVVTGQGQAESASPVSSASGDQWLSQLQDAKAMLARADVDGAHRRIQGLPLSSNLRADTAFRNIEARWADAMLERAERATTAEESRLLLDRVARATTVDDIRRRRASDKLVALAPAGAVEVGDLPKAKPTLAPTTVAPERAIREVAASELAPAHVPAGPPARVPSSTSQTAGSPTTAQVASPAVDMAASGDLAKAQTAKESLKAKVNAGTATDQDRRILRGLCRQLGDSSCSR